MRVDKEVAGEVLLESSVFTAAWTCLQRSEFACVATPLAMHVGHAVKVQSGLVQLE